MNLFVEHVSNKKIILIFLLHTAISLLFINCDWEEDWLVGNNNIRVINKTTYTIQYLSLGDTTFTDIESNSETDYLPMGNIYSKNFKFQINNNLYEYDNLYLERFDAYDYKPSLTIYIIQSSNSANEFFKLNITNDEYETYTSEE